MNESGSTKRVKSRRDKVYIVWIRIQLAYLSIHTGAVGLYRQSKVYPPTALLMGIHPGICIQQWSSGPHLVKYSGPSSGFLSDAPASGTDLHISYTV